MSLVTKSRHEVTDSRGKQDRKRWTVPYRVGQWTDCPLMTPLRPLSFVLCERSCLLKEATRAECRVLNIASCFDIGSVPSWR